MDKWQELTIEVNREVEEAASNILIESGSQGVAIDDSADYMENANRFGELYPEVEQVETVKITAYYPESADIEAITKQVNERLAEYEKFAGYVLIAIAVRKRFAHIDIRISFKSSII